MNCVLSHGPHPVVKERAFLYCIFKKFPNRPATLRLLTSHSSKRRYTGQDPRLQKAPINH